jgi:hypothetical protein
VKSTKVAAVNGKAVPTSDDEKHAEGTKLGHYILGKDIVHSIYSLRKITW